MAYSTISKPSLYFNTHLYTGNGSTQSITGVGFQPDWTILKGRNASNSHNVYDAVRGAGKTIVTDANYAESTDTARLTSFDSDGFSLGSNANVNENNINFVSWNWKANGAGSANTDGTINTTATSVNTTAGFSISKYTGTGSNATVGHGLGAVPKMIMVKSLTTTADWRVQHGSLGATKALDLNSNAQANTQIGNWNNTEPTSSVFSVGTFGATNTNGGTHIAYCFAEKKGYSKFGSYTGNGNADGTFIYTGFKPSLIIIKDTANAGENWFIFDSKRPGHNFNANLLNPNSSTTETTSGANGIDIISNGFKARSTNNGTNRSGANFIYMAIAEEPLVANVGASIPATAR